MTVIFLLLVLLASCTPSGTDDPSNSQPVTYIENKGSDTIVNLALAWAERYQTVKPEVILSVTGGGSGTGLAALLNGTVDIANASRQIKAEEIADAESKGFTPEEFIIARDAIAVILKCTNRHN